MKTLHNLLSLVSKTAKDIDAVVLDIRHNGNESLQGQRAIDNLTTIKNSLENVEIIDAERRENMLTGALEGGSNEWYWLSNEAMTIIEKYRDRSKKQNTLVEMMFRALTAGETIPIHDVENRREKQIGQINLQSIRAGEFAMIEKHPHHIYDIINGNDDCFTADAWFQMAALGSIVYG